MKKTLIVLLAVILAGGLTASTDREDVPAPAPMELHQAQGAGASCTTVWLSMPSWQGKFTAGTKHCLNMADRTNGWVKVYQSGKVVDYVNPRSTLTAPPNNGRVQSTADTVRWMAKKHGVSLQFANADTMGRQGCSGEFRYGISASYQPSYEHPGKGLVRIGTGTVKRCMNDRRMVLDVARHEIAHAIMDRKCGEKAWGSARNEQVTDAYAYRYLGATTKSPGHYGFTKRDAARAVAIAQGRC
jgi:hypothetical protein